MSTNSGGSTDQEPNTSAGVLFDVDGTLLDTNYLHTLAWWQAMRDAGISGVSMAEIHQAIGIASEGLMRRLTGTENEAAIEAHSRRYDQLQDQAVAFDGAAELLHHCVDAGLRVVLATSGTAADLDWMLPAIGVPEDLLAGATTSEDVAESKPAPDLLTTAMADHHLDHSRTVAVGDTVWDVQAAHQATVACIGFTSGGISARQLLDAGADEIWSGPADLLQHFDESLLGRLT